MNEQEIDILISERTQELYNNDGYQGNAYKHASVRQLSYYERIARQQIYEQYNIIGEEGE